jgi:hypothetical protein
LRKPMNFMKYLHSILLENDRMARRIKTDTNFGENWIRHRVSLCQHGAQGASSREGF